MAEQTQAMVDKVQQVAAWGRSEPAPSRPSYYDGGATENSPAFDWRAVVQDLALRVETLQAANARVLVSVDKYNITLSTVVKVAAPAPKPPEPASTLTISPAVTGTITIQPPDASSCNVAGCPSCTPPKAKRPRKASVRTR